MGVSPTIKLSEQQDFPALYFDITSTKSLVTRVALALTSPDLARTVRFSILLLKMFAHEKTQVVWEM